MEALTDKALHALAAGEAARPENPDWTIDQGWDALSARLDEHLNALGAMRLSPYFSAAQEFAEEAGLWEERLGRVKAALELWMVVQKR